MHHSHARWFKLPEHQVPKFCACIRQIIYGLIFGHIHSLNVDANVNRLVRGFCLLLHLCVALLINFNVAALLDFQVHG